MALIDNPSEESLKLEAIDNPESLVKTVAAVANPLLPAKRTSR